MLVGEWVLLPFVFIRLPCSGWNFLSECVSIRPLLLLLLKLRRYKFHITKKDSIRADKHHAHEENKAYRHELLCICMRLFNGMISPLILQSLLPRSEWSRAFLTHHSSNSLHSGSLSPLHFGNWSESRQAKEKLVAKEIKLADSFVVHAENEKIVVVAQYSKELSNHQPHPTSPTGRKEGKEAADVDSMKLPVTSASKTLAWGWLQTFSSSRLD